MFFKKNMNFNNFFTPTPEISTSTSVEIRHEPIQMAPASTSTTVSSLFVRENQKIFYIFF